MLVTHYANVACIGSIFIGKLYLHLVIIPDLVNGGSFLPDNVGMVFRIHLEVDSETSESLQVKGRKGEGGEFTTI